MLQVIDQRWRDHLAEMDYLREGINLRAMGQQDPLVAWQREGFAMFGQLMESIDDDYLRFVLHVEAVTEPASEPDLAQAEYGAAFEPVQDSSSHALSALADQGVDVAALSPAVPAGASGAARAANGARAGGRRSPNGAQAPPPDEETLVPVVKAPQEKIGRNDPCWCGSGKKYKLCHGAA